ncbi:MAG: hypothetical protein LBT89_08635, partial [Planctomycetaceae bacterium]|nr:hypothetical protein [Planctomycetaceae bacterium]
PKKLLTTLKKWIKMTSKSPACEEIIYASPLSFVCVCLPVMLSAAATAEPIVFDFESGSLAGKKCIILQEVF